MDALVLVMVEHCLVPLLPPLSSLMVVPSLLALPPVLEVPSIFNLLLLVSSQILQLRIVQRQVVGVEHSAFDQSLSALQCIESRLILVQLPLGVVACIFMSVTPLGWIVMEGWIMEL